MAYSSDVLRDISPAERVDIEFATAFSLEAIANGCYVDCDGIERGDRMVYYALVLPRTEFERLLEEVNAVDVSEEGQPPTRGQQWEGILAWGIIARLPSFRIRSTRRKALLASLESLKETQSPTTS